MGIPKANIVQAEFFHVGGNETATLDDVIAECKQRTDEVLRDILSGVKVSFFSNGIKTCVRFYDTDGSLTTFIQHAEGIHNQHLKAFKTNIPQKGLRRMWTLMKLNRLVDREYRCETQKAPMAIEGLKRALQCRTPVGVEVSDHRYEPLPADHAYELLEAVRRSKNAWLFLFAHNEDLFADKNELIGSVM